MPDPVSTDLYVYLRGGRGDGFVPHWNGFVDEEGSYNSNPDEGEEAMSVEGREVGEPYRDIFQGTSGPFVTVPENISVGGGGSTYYHANKLVPMQGSGFVVRGPLTSEAWFYASPVEEGEVAGEVSTGGISGTLEATISDEVGHHAPRQHTKVCTWLIFGSTLGEAFKFKFRKADVIGWGARRRDE